MFRRPLFAQLQRIPSQPQPRLLTFTSPPLRTTLLSAARSSSSSTKLSPTSTSTSTSKPPTITRASTNIKHLYNQLTMCAAPLTPSLLRRWNASYNDHVLPDREAIRAIHVYDFDNTLFQTPLPNARIWHGPTLSMLQGVTWLATGGGGWWHDQRILAATGEGVDVESKRAWEGWWNESVVDLVKLSMEQKDALCVLLTGRGAGEKRGFEALLNKICESRGLRFDMMVLKPENWGTTPESKGRATTIEFKTQFLGELLNTYLETEELKIYEDRVKHVRAFEDWCVSYVKSTYRHRAHLKAEVIQVAEESRALNPSVELREVQKMLSEHNALQTRPQHTLRIKKTVFYTGYLLSASATAHVLNALEIPKLVASENDVKLLANNVLITPRPASRSVLEKTGVLGQKVEFVVTNVGNWEGRVWAAIVRPVDPKIRVYTDNAQPIIVLAVRRSAKPIDAGRIEKWSAPPSPNIRFHTVVGERLLLRIEEEGSHYEGEWESLFPNKRRPMVGLNEGSGGSGGSGGAGQQQMGYHTHAYGHPPSVGGMVPQYPAPPPLPSAAPPFGYQRGERSMWNS